MISTRNALFVLLFACLALPLRADVCNLLSSSGASSNWSYNYVANSISGVCGPSCSIASNSSYTILISESVSNPCSEFAVAQVDVYPDANSINAVRGVVGIFSGITYII